MGLDVNLVEEGNMKRTDQSTAQNLSPRKAAQYIVCRPVEIAQSLLQHAEKWPARYKQKVRALWEDEVTSCILRLPFPAP